MAINKTLIIVFSLLMALVLFTKHVDQCCDVFADSNSAIADIQIADEDHTDADEPAVLTNHPVSFHPILANTLTVVLTQYNQPDLAVTLKPPRG